MTYHQEITESEDIIVDSLNQDLWFMLGYFKSNNYRPVDASDEFHVLRTLIEMEYRGLQL